mgnify:CR=1 FL=1
MLKIKMHVVFCNSGTYYLTSILVNLNNIKPRYYLTSILFNIKPRYYLTPVLLISPIPGPIWAYFLAPCVSAQFGGPLFQIYF